jgi:RNA polymerase sigma-70 factor (ECF subfamily)
MLSGGFGGPREDAIAHEPDEEVFRQVAVACLDGLYGFALSLSRDRVMAEDLVQETYLRALKARRKADPGENVRSWLFTILHNVWRNEQRRRRPEALEDYPDMMTVLPSPEPDPQLAFDRAQNRNRLEGAIAELPTPFREALVLRCVEGFSYKEMAEIVGCPAGTVMSRLARARGLLRRALGPSRLPVLQEKA